MKSGISISGGVPGIFAAATILSSSMASAVCTDLSPTMTRPLVTSFMNRPVGILERFPLGGTDLRDRLNTVLIADVKMTLPGILELIRSANQPQKEAIGTAMGASFASCLKFGDSRAAEQLRTAAARLTDRLVQTAYYSATSAIVETDPRAKPPGSAEAEPEKRGSLPVGRLNNPFLPTPRYDPLRPIGTVR